MAPLPASHRCVLPLAGLARILVPPALSLLILAGLLHVAASRNLLPLAAPADLDRTILVAKARLAREAGPATVVLAGDSSCLMDVDARQLSGGLGTSVLNLGTLSYLDLPAHGRLVSELARRHPGQPGTVVLLLHPEALRQSEAAPGYREFLDAWLTADDPSAAAARNATAPGTRGSRVAEWLAGPVLRERVIQPAIPPLLSGDFGAAYGSVRLVECQLREGLGSLIDPTHFDPAAERGSGEYRLTPAIERSSREFREQIPPAARLIVGITPVPASLATSSHATRMRGLLTTWAGWLRADRALTDLPFTFPEDRFATLTHLNRRGAEQFTEALARELTVSPIVPR